MTNPFEDQDGTYRVLVNAEGQHSLWPSHVAVPQGWDIAFDKSGRQECLDFVEKNWTDMRPESLRRVMADATQS